MELLKSKEPISLEAAKLHIDREKEGPERRMMVLKLCIPIPTAGMYDGLPDAFSRIYEAALRAAMAGSDGFKMATIGHEMKGQRIHIYDLPTGGTPRCTVEYGDLKNFRLCREEDDGRFYLRIDCVFDYTNQNSQASTWAKDGLGSSFYWSCEAIQQSLVEGSPSEPGEETPQAREKRKASARKSKGQAPGTDDAD